MCVTGHVYYVCVYALDILMTLHNLIKGTNYKTNF